MQEEVKFDIEENGLDDYSASQFTASHVGVQKVEISGGGIALNEDCMQEFNFMEGAEASVMIMPGFMVVTNHPGKEKVIKAIEELQYRQDELKVDFSQAIIELVKSVKY